jgi:hypothetical protein
MAVADKNRSISLLQIAGTLAVIAFHVGIRGAAWGWIAVILFFALAGSNMSGAVGRSQGVFEYASARVCRLGFPLALVWCLLATMALFKTETPGANWFLISSPLFLQNWTPLFFEYQFPADWIFGHLWFVGALLQLQLLVFACRKIILKSPPLAVAGVAVLIGTTFRWSAARFLGGNGAEIDVSIGVALYNLPLTHIEAITFGLLVGRGRFPGLGRHLPAAALLATGALVLGAVVSGGAIPVESFGLQLPFRASYMYLWAYPVLGLVAASLCSPENPIAARVRAMTVAPSTAKVLSTVAALSYGAYVFHGFVLMSAAPLSSWLVRKHVHAGPIVRSFVILGSFVLAMVHQAGRRRPLLQTLRNVVRRPGAAAAGVEGTTRRLRSPSAESVESRSISSG